MGDSLAQLDVAPLEAQAAAVKPQRKIPYHLIVLLFLTCFAGFIRFAWIDRPSLWNDEGHTFRRLTGSFQDLLDVLQVSGFSPLHYELYWWMGDKLGGAHKLTPFWMRVVPSLAGTLMVPAIYFLARQMCSKRTSLLVAAYAACSAYLMAYSHDAKMYMHFWLFCTLNVGCLLWWFRMSLAGAMGRICCGLQPARGCIAGSGRTTNMIRRIRIRLSTAQEVAAAAKVLRGCFRVAISIPRFTRDWRRR